MPFIQKYWRWVRLRNCMHHESNHYDDVIMTTIASQTTSLTVVYSIVNSGVDQRKHQSSASLAFVWGIHRRPVNSPHKWPVTRKMFPFDDVIMLDGKYHMRTNVPDAGIRGRDKYLHPTISAGFDYLPSPLYLLLAHESPYENMFPIFRSSRWCRRTFVFMAMQNKWMDIYICIYIYIHI